MSAFFEQSMVKQIEELELFSREILSHYDLDVIEIETINYEYNMTLKVSTCGGQKYALRININSLRTRENLRAEVSWVDHLHSDGKVRVAQPIKTRQGDLFVSIFHPHSNKEFHCVLYTWLEGRELPEEPELAQIYTLGQVMARMHLVTKNFHLPPAAKLPTLDDVLWRSENYLLGSKSVLDDYDKDLISQVFEVIDKQIEFLYLAHEAIIIHADLHGGNLLWADGTVAVIDFDDSAIGLPVQDFATAIYYLDTPEQDAALRDGYRSVAPLPEMTDRDLEIFLIQRRIILLNYLFETKNIEHRALIPAYLVETMRRIKVFLHIS
jgi:Ser/Thr protein kinase RdoA (MazF antagonist)